MCRSIISGGGRAWPPAGTAEDRGSAPRARWRAGGGDGSGVRGGAREPRCGGTGRRAGLGFAAARCRNRSAGAGSGARRPGQRRRRLSLLLPGSLFLRFLLLLAGSPPPPQPRRSSGFSSPSRPGRPAGTIPESEGLLPFPAAVGGHL